MMNLRVHKLAWLTASLFILWSCGMEKAAEEIDYGPTTAEILGDPQMRAISYGGYRQTSRDQQPTVGELAEDMKLLHALGIRLIRTYNVTRPHAQNVLKAIDSIQQGDPSFEMYVMLGAWMDCKNAWTDLPVDHMQESPENAKEIDRAVQLAQKYPSIVKIIAVGNEAMVHWAETYRLHPKFILHWVRHLQELKSRGELTSDLWITSSDNFASWGGGSEAYHLPQLDSLIRAVDFVSLHTYPMHDTHYNPDFWGLEPDEESLPAKDQIDSAMTRSLHYAISQFNSVKRYVRRIDADVPLHIGETGWASKSSGHYGPKGSQACDEYKQGIYHKLMRSWTEDQGISCFYFEGFDEPWKDAQNPDGSENHFGLFTVDGQAKYPIWKAVDDGLFEGMTRGGNSITKTFGGDLDSLLRSVNLPPARVINIEIPATHN